MARSAVHVSCWKAFEPRCRPDADTVKAMGKMIKQEGESTRTAVRAARRTALEQVKGLPSKDTQRQEEKKASHACFCHNRS